MVKRKHQLTGAEIIIESLLAENTEYVFGYPGGAVLNIYDALFKQTDLKHILVRHEQGAVHAADGYARASGKVGVALVTSGPGITNAVTGIATAYADSIPLVIISGQVPSSLIGNDAFQEVDAVGITRPIVKHSFLVKDINQLAITIKKAFYLAATGRPGPVLVDVPKDITSSITDFVYPDTIKIRSYKPTTVGHIGQIKRAAKLLKKAQRPIIYAGGGVVLGNAHAELLAVAKHLNSPVTLTLMGLGAFPASDKNYLGMLGMHGNYEANLAMHHCDVLLAIGARFDDRVTGNIAKFCPHAEVIHIDIDPSSISKNFKVDVPIVGSVKSVLSDLLNTLDDEETDLSAWWQQINEWRAVQCLDYEKSDTEIKPQQLIETLYELTEGHAIVASDVGQHQMWTAQYYRFDEPRHWLNSGGAGTMGYGYPAAIGGALARPDLLTVCITGDGSIQMMLQELATAKQYNIPVKIVCLNNGFLGMVRQWQELFYENRYSFTDMQFAPDFVKLAEAYGHHGVRISNPKTLRDELKQALETEGTIFIDVLVSKEENVFPMIPAGGGQNEIILAKHIRNQNIIDDSEEGMVLV